MNKSNHSTDGSFILVVEDYAKLLRNIAFLLQVAGQQVITASSSAEAQQILARQKPDLILADVDMSNGYEFLRAVRGERRHHTTPFIAMSEKYELHDLMHAMDLGANDYLPKPFDAYDLVNVVRDNLAYSSNQRKAS
jgi:DNA-binding response OmpR family regulator